MGTTSASQKVLTRWRISRSSAVNSSSTRKKSTNGDAVSVSRSSSFPLFLCRLHQGHMDVTHELLSEVVRHRPGLERRGVHEGAHMAGGCRDLPLVHNGGLERPPDPTQLDHPETPVRPIEQPQRPLVLDLGGYQHRNEALRQLPVERREGVKQ